MVRFLDHNKKAMKYIEEKIYVTQDITEIILYYFNKSFQELNNDNA